MVNYVVVPHTAVWPSILLMYPKKLFCSLFFRHFCHFISKESSSALWPQYIISNSVILPLTKVMTDKLIIIRYQARLVHIKSCSFIVDRSSIFSNIRGL